MDMRHQMAIAQQQEMQAAATARRQAARARALAKATRRVERAEHRLNRSMVHVMRLRAEMAAGHGK